MVFFGHETVINQVSTTQLVQLTADVLTPGQPQPGHGASTPEAAPDTVGIGDHDEAVSSRQVNLISRYK